MSSSVGGIESFIMNVYRNIDKSKVQFDFLTFGNQIAYSDEIEKMGGRIYKLTSRKENYTENRKQLYDFFKEHQEYRTFHYHLNTCSYITPMVIAHKAGLKNIIAHSHNQWKGKSLRIKVAHNINRPKVLKYANHLFSCSDIAGKYMFGNDVVKSKKYKLINNAIDANLYKYNQDLRDKYRRNLKLDGKFVVGHVGRFNYQKNHDFILDIFNYVFKSNPNAVLLLIGNGELEDAVKSKIEGLGLSKSVIMLGVRNDIPQLLQAMDVFLFPSHFEGFGIAALESQAAGLKTIVSEALPDDIKVTELLEVIPLERPASYWAKQIIMHDLDHTDLREKYNKKIVDSGYDIMETVKILEDCYLSKK